MTSSKGQARWAKMTSNGGGGGQANTTCVLPDPKVNKAEYLTYIS
jgi:hypothetical protein